MRKIHSITFSLSRNLNEILFCFCLFDQINLWQWKSKEYLELALHSLKQWEYQNVKNLHRSFHFNTQEAKTWPIKFKFKANFSQYTTQLSLEFILSHFESQKFVPIHKTGFILKKYIILTFESSILPMHTVKNKEFPQAQLRMSGWWVSRILHGTRDICGNKAVI